VRGAVAIAIAALALGCGGPDRGAKFPGAFDAAAKAESAGRFADAARLYDAAANEAKIPRDRDHTRYLAARALDRSGDRSGAATRLRAIAGASPAQEDSAAAAYAVADMEIAGGDDDGWASLEQVARKFPASGVSRRAIDRVARHLDDTAGAKATYDHLVAIAPSLDATELGETVRYEMALRLVTLGQDKEARDAFLALATRWPYPRGAFWDDALYRASVLDEKLGDPRAAVADLERMLRERESSLALPLLGDMGTYERPRFEPAMIRLCALYRDRLNDRAKARACFGRVYSDLTTSELRDDALWEQARLAREDGDASASCSALATLVRAFPDSRYVPCATATCPGLDRPKKSGAPATCHPYIGREKPLGAESSEASEAKQTAE
jgi:tetratricopeptide (TPR) repeat protein